MFEHKANDGKHATTVQELENAGIDYKLIARVDSSRPNLIQYDIHPELPEQTGVMDDDGKIFNAMFQKASELYYFDAVDDNNLRY